MKTIIRRFALALAVLLSIQSNAQMSLGAKRGDYTFGLNAGFAYQSSDIRSGGNGGGFGLTLGRTVLAGAYAPISVEMRGRLLYARTFGLDPFRSFQIENNKALNGTGDLNYVNYPLNLDVPRGFVFQNHRTTHGELALEAVFTLEELRRKTGFIASVFGGIGIDGYHVKIDQADASGQPYYNPYVQLNENRPVSAVLRDLRGSILDGTYETNADGFDGLPKFGLMPSVGVELGFHLTPSLSLHAGHRLTFAGTDLLDGHQWASQDKDMYHYTNFGFTYRFRPPARPAVLPPVIDITAPLSRPHYTRDPNGVVLAMVRNVRNAGEVTCMVNGRATPFRFSGEQFSLDFPLQPGTNNVVITARNRAGSARADAVIILEQVILPPPPPPVGYAPRVSISNPPNRSVTVSEPDFNLRASVSEVTNRNDIELTVDGARRDFSFDSRSGNLSAQINLREGANRIRISARNSFGSDAADAEIIYEPRRFAPTVRILEPADRSEVQVNSVTIRAEVRYMELQENVYLYVNSRETRNFDFDAGRETLRATVTLLEGANTIELRARNRSGEARDEVTVTYRRPVQPQAPTVTITVPSSANTTTTAASAVIEATTRHVQRRDEVSFFVNGARNDNFSFNTSNGRFSATVNLITGNNDIAIRVANAGGSDQAAVSIRRTDQGGELPLPPRVRITSPANQSVSDRNTADVRATIDNVSERNSISLYVNGARSSDFSFNPRNRELSALVSLLEGNNTIRVEAVNRDGNAADEINVRYRRGTPPAVTITAPDNNSTTTNAAATLRARVQHVADRNQISVTLNGANVSGFTFNTSSGELSANVTLVEGNNTLRVRASTPDGADEKSVNVTYRKATPPAVAITAPDNNSTTTNAAVTLRARVQHVADRNQISVTLNGAGVSGFTFNTSSGELSANVTLVEGNNTLRVRASTPDGSDEKSVNVTYRKATPPTVAITAPDNNSTTTNASTTLRARLQHVADRNQISVTLNGANVGNFTFNTSSGELSANVTLVEGNNTLRVRASTPDGADEKSVSVTYRKATPPAVTITAPDNNSTTANASTTLRARVQHVTDRNQISVTLNGAGVSGFTFNTSSGELSANVTLVEGNNTLRVRASTPDGADEKSVNVTYRKATPPTVVIKTPENNATVDVNMVQVLATITHMRSIKGITFTVNDKTVTLFSFENGNFSANVENLREGDNTIAIAVQNPDGADLASVKVNYRPKPEVPKPVVRFIIPARGGAQVRTSETQIKASVMHVQSKDDIRLERNGKVLDDFTYHPKEQELTATVPVDIGANNIKIIATNASGSDTATTLVVKPEFTARTNPPVVNIESVSQPTLNPMDPSQGRSTVIAVIRGVETAAQITFTVNGTASRDFTFNSKTGAFQSTINLVRGTNTIILRAENVDGTDEKTRTLEF